MACLCNRSTWTNGRTIIALCKDCSLAGTACLFDTENSFAHFLCFSAASITRSHKIDIVAKALKNCQRNKVWKLVAVSKVSKTENNGQYPWGLYIISSYFIYCLFHCMPCTYVSSCSRSRLEFVRKNLSPFSRFLPKKAYIGPAVKRFFTHVSRVNSWEPSPQTIK